jgi:hypothetical protein
MEIAISWLKTRRIRGLTQNPQHVGFPAEDLGLCQRENQRYTSDDAPKGA